MKKPHHSATIRRPRYRSITGDTAAGEDLVV